MTRALVIGLAALVAAAPVAEAADRPEDAGGLLGRMVAFARARVDEAIAAREPVLRPPQPVKVTWRPRRLSTHELDGPLLALAGADLDGDGRDEVLALTAGALLVLRPDRTGALVEVTRAALPGSPAPIRPRDPVGTLVIEAAPGAKPRRVRVRVRSSARAEGAVFAWSDGALISEAARSKRFPLCATVEGELERGRNYFAGVLAVRSDGGSLALPERFYAMGCRSDLVDALGRRLELQGIVSVDGSLTVRAQTRCPSGDQACDPHAVDERLVSGAGVAFALADVDRDGRPEVIASSDGAPGQPDAVRVVSLIEGRQLERHRHAFAGGVAAVATADLDGDGAVEVLVAVRTLGSPRVELWRLN